MQFSIRQLLAIILLIGLSLWAYKNIAIVRDMESRLKARQDSQASLESKLKSIEVRVELSEDFLKNHRPPSQTLLKAIERKNRLRSRSEL